MENLEVFWDEFWSWKSMKLGFRKFLSSVLSVAPYLLMALYMYQETGSFCVWFKGLKWWQELIAETLLVPVSFCWSFIEELQRVRAFFVWLLTFVGLCVCLYFQCDYADVPLALWSVVVPVMVHCLLFSREDKTKWSWIVLVGCLVAPVVVYICALYFLGATIPQYPMTYVGILTLAVTLVVCYQTWNDSKTTQVTCKSNQKDRYFPDSNGGITFEFPVNKKGLHEDGEDFEAKTTTEEENAVAIFVVSLHLKSGIEALLFVLFLFGLLGEMKRACYVLTNMWWVKQEPDVMSKAFWLLGRACLASFTFVLLMLQKIQGHNLVTMEECAYCLDLFSGWVPHFSTGGAVPA
jgi:hypothetical protein